MVEGMALLAGFAKGALRALLMTSLLLALCEGSRVIMTVASIARNQIVNNAFQESRLLYIYEV